MFIVRVGDAAYSLRATAKEIYNLKSAEASAGLKILPGEQFWVGDLGIVNHSHKSIYIEALT